MLLELQGKPVLHHVLDRILDAETIDEVVFATIVQERDAVIVQAVEDYGDPRVNSFRGLEDDVLDRHHGAAKASEADIMVRITSDCPLINPEIIDQVVRKLLDDPTLDYAGNVLGKLTYTIRPKTACICRRL